MLFVQLRAAARDPPVDRTLDRGIPRRGSHCVMAVRALEPHLTVLDREGEQRHPAGVAFGGPIGLEHDRKSAPSSSVHACRLFITAEVYGLGAFSPRT
jgi:hypothetical protein